MWLLYAAASAVCFGLRGILYQRVSQRPLNRDLLLFGVYLCGTIVALIGTAITGQTWTQGAWTGLLMGTFSFIANAAMYKGFAVGKASLVAVFTALPAVVVAAAAFMLWGETFHSAQWAAFLLIVGGIVLIRYAGVHSVRDLRGIHWAVLALFGFGFNDVSGKAATRFGGETFPTLTVMFGVGSLLFWIVWRLSVRKQTPLSSERAEIAAANVSRMTAIEAETDAAGSAGLSNARTVALGMAVGTTNISGMILILSAFRLGITGLVSAVVALNVVLILLYARVFLKETFAPKEWTGATMALAGIALLKILG